jgi:hypothetical protein
MMMVLLSSRSGRSMVIKQPGDVRIVVWFQLQNLTRGGAKCWMKYGSVGRLLTKNKLPPRKLQRGGGAVRTNGPKKNNCDGVGVSMKTRVTLLCCTHEHKTKTNCLSRGRCVEKRVTQIMLYAQLNVRHVMRVWVRGRERVAPFVLYAQ